MNNVKLTSDKIVNKIFNSLDNKHQIDIKIIDDIAWFNINKLDCDQCKTFLLLVKDILNYLNKNNVNTIKQYIYAEDIEYFKKSSCVDIGNNEYIVSTNIIHFLSELTNALNIKGL